MNEKNKTISLQNEVCREEKPLKNASEIEDIIIDEDEKIDLAAEKILAEYRPAFEELAK